MFDIQCKKCGAATTSKAVFRDTQCSVCEERLDDFEERDFYQVTENYDPDVGFVVRRFRMDNEGQLFDEDDFATGYYHFRKKQGLIFDNELAAHEYVNNMQLGRLGGIWDELEA